MPLPDDTMISFEIPDVYEAEPPARTVECDGLTFGEVKGEMVEALFYKDVDGNKIINARILIHAGNLVIGTGLIIAHQCELKGKACRIKGRRGTKH